jgi:phosphoglycerate kinase
MPNAANSGNSLRAVQSEMNTGADQVTRPLAQTRRREAFAMNKKTLRDVDVRGKRVLVRVDFNVPLENGKITDDARIRAALPTLHYLIDRGAITILCSHLGRPKGKPTPAYTLAPVASRVGALLERPVAMAPDCVGPAVEGLARTMRPGEVLLLENLRFHAEEEANDPRFARALASLAELYVDDAFGSAHRAHASTAGVAAHLPAVAGLLMERELEFLGRALADPMRPFVAILGGAKVSDKIGVIERLLGAVDTLLVGGGMANTFFKAQGKQVGASLVENEKLDVAKALLQRAGDRLVLPVDIVVASRTAADAPTRTIGPDEVPAGWRIVDVGPATLAAFAGRLRGARTVFWNGPMGVFEIEPFASGTRGFARLLADLPGATTIVGGGDSVAALEQAGIAAKITHVSTGGGAALEFIEGRELPGVAVLEDK